MSEAPAKEAKTALRTRACELFGVEYPIVQTGMGWVAGARLTSATSAAGGLGILASATMNLAQLKAAIAEVKSRTDKPFGVNLLPSQADAEERVKLIIDNKVKVASFAQAPGKEIIKRLKGAGVVTTLRTTSPQAATVVSSVWLIVWMVGLRLCFKIPWNWMAWRVVTRRVPSPCSSVRASSAKYCAPVRRPAGMRTRTMKL